MVPNVVKGSGFRGLMLYLLVGRQKASIIGGNMAGRNALELTREFGICRRMRPDTAKPVMHHTLSFADHEDPGDAGIAVAAERYIESMALDGHQWVAVVHRDKEHIHVHLAINRIGLDGSWWNATHDYERSQVIAAKVEVELGFVLVPRVRLQPAIQKALRAAQIVPPELPRPVVETERKPKHVLEEIRERLDRIPVGLSAPDWIAAVEGEGLHLHPSIGGKKISGFTVSMPGHRAVKLSDVDRSMSWPKLTASGRVRYDPFFHFDAIAKLKRKDQPDGDQGASPETPQIHKPDPDQTFDAGSGNHLWEWESLYGGMVAPEVGSGTGSATAGPVASAPGRAPVVRQIETSQPGAAHAGERGDGARLADELGVPSGRVRDDEFQLQELPPAQDVELLPPGQHRQRQHVLGDDSGRQSGHGDTGDPGVDAPYGNARSAGPSAAQEALGQLALSMGGSQPSGGDPDAPARSGAGDPEGDAGWGGVYRDARELTGVQVDYEDLGLPAIGIPENVRLAAREVVRHENNFRPSGRELEQRARGRETLWEESEQARLSAHQYRQAKASAIAAKELLSPARDIIRGLVLGAKSGAISAPSSVAEGRGRARTMAVPAPGSPGAGGVPGRQYPGSVVRRKKP